MLQPYNQVKFAPAVFTTYAAAQKRVRDYEPDAKYLWISNPDPEPANLLTYVLDVDFNLYYAVWYLPIES